MNPIANFRAFWHPGQNAFGIQIQLQTGQPGTLRIDTPEEFIAVLSI